MDRAAFIHPASRDLVQADAVGAGTRIWSNVVALPGSRSGAHATILCGDPVRVIGRWALVGVQALVTRDVRHFALVVGAPARFVRWICPHGSGHPVEERPDGLHCRACAGRLNDLVAASDRR